VKDYGEALRVRNLREFRDTLKDAAAGLPGVLQKANKLVAQFVVDRAGARARSQGKAAARAAKGLSASAGQLSATVRLNAEKVPGALGEEFGAAHNSDRIVRPHPGSRSWETRTHMLGWNQFPNWTGNGLRAGIFLYPTIRDTREQQVDLYDQAVAGILAGAFPD
jgi:hypothetical protein